MFAKQMTTTINATPAEVFGYVTDLPRHAEWANEPLEVCAEPGATGLPGSRYTSTAMGKVHASIEVVEREPNHRFVYDCTDIFRHYRWTMQIAPEGSGSRLTLSMDRLSGPWYIRAIQPWLLWPLRGCKSVAGGLANIKRRVESPDAVSHAGIENALLRTGSRRVA